MLGALLLTWTEKRAPQQQEALIGVMFILAACAGILLLAGNPHGGEHLKDLLVGQILWVNTTQLLWLGGLSALLLAALWLGWVERLGRFGFYGGVRARRHRVGAAGRRLPGVLEPDHSGARHARTGGQGALRHRLWRRRARLCARPGAVGACSTCRRAR